MHIVQGIQEALGIGFKADITTVQGRLKFLVLRIEGIFAVSTERITLQEERMRCIAHDVIVRILTALRHDGFSHETAIVIPKMEISSNIRWVADFLQGQHIRPERIHKTGIVLRENFAQSQPRIEQEIFLLLFTHMTSFFRIVIIAEDIVGHCLDIEPRTLIRNRNPLSERHKVMRIHIVLDQLSTTLRASQ